MVMDLLFLAKFTSQKPCLRSLLLNTLLFLPVPCSRSVGTGRGSLSGLVTAPDGGTGPPCGRSRQPQEQRSNGTFPGFTLASLVLSRIISCTNLSAIMRRECGTRSAGMYIGLE